MLRIYPEPTLGGRVTASQHKYYHRFRAVIIVWPLMVFGGVFIFDEPEHGLFDMVYRYLMFGLILLFPVYLTPMFRWGLKMTEKNDDNTYFFIIPLLPFVIFFILMLLEILLK